MDSNIIIISGQHSICKVFHPIILYPSIIILISMFKSIVYIGLGFATAFPSLRVQCFLRDWQWSITTVIFTQDKLRKDVQIYWWTLERSGYYSRYYSVYL